MSRDVAVVAFAQTPMVRRVEDANEVELVMPVVTEVLRATGLDIGVTVSGSTDYLMGVPFSFVGALDAVGAWPPIEESHVEMDGAFALYEAWVKLQTGEIDSALIYSFGKTSMGDPAAVLNLQLDPYTVSPLGIDAVSLAALQARLLLDSGRYTEKDMAEVVARSRRSAKSNSNAQLRGDVDPAGLLAEPYYASPLRKHDCCPVSDGATALVIAAGDLARKVAKRPAWIRGIDHRIESHDLGLRDLTRSPSTALAAERAGAR